MNIVLRTTVMISFLVMTNFFAIGQSKGEHIPQSVISKDGVSIAYEVHGSGALGLIFVHGWSCDRSYWKSQVPSFSDTYTVVTLDLGGHGESSLGRENWTITSFGHDVAAVVKKLDLKRVILIGHSMGGDVIVDAAFHFPDRIVGLIMVDTYNTLGEGRSMQQIQEFIEDFSIDFPAKVQNLVRSLYLPDSDPALVDAVAQDMSAAPPEVALSAIKWSFTHSRQITHDLSLLDLPVIAINADYNQTDIKAMQRHGVETVIMPGVGHFLMMEEPHNFNKLLETTINSLIL